MCPIFGARSNQPSKSWHCSSSIIMLCIMMYARMMLLMVSRFHWQMGFLTIPQRPCKILKALSMQLLVSLEVLLLPLPHVNGVNEAAPKGVDAICEQIEMRISMTIYLEGHVLLCSSQEVWHQWRLVKNIDVVIAS